MDEQRFPMTLSLEGADLTFRSMTAADGAAVLRFARALPAHDLLYVPRDITNDKVVAAWVAATGEGDIDTVLAFHDADLVGCGALVCDPLSWSPHLGELRVLVAPEMRNKGLGRLLIQECFRIAVARGLRKLTARMTVDQKGAVAIFEELGFSGEALLKNHVLDRDGELHDIVALACDVERAHAQMSAYGLGG